jgi:hypothetical protein
MPQWNKMSETSATVPICVGAHILRPILRVRDSFERFDSIRELTRLSLQGTIVSTGLAA